MRFNCGPSIGDRLEGYFERRRGRLKKWHKYFTFMPTRINGTCIWLEYVERKGTCKIMDPWVWIYKLIDR